MQMPSFDIIFSQRTPLNLVNMLGMLYSLFIKSMQTEKIKGFYIQVSGAYGKAN